MAETVAAFLKANGNDIKGESTVHADGRQDSIEVIELHTGVTTAREAGTHAATGRREHTGIEFVKRIDSASPLLMKALTKNEVITGTFKYYRPNEAGDGTTEQFYTIEIKDGRVADVHNVLPNTHDAATANMHPLERVRLVYGDITWTYTKGGITHNDTWKGSRG